MVPVEKNIFINVQFFLIGDNNPHFTMLEGEQHRILVQELINQLQQIHMRNGGYSPASSFGSSSNCEDPGFSGVFETNCRQYKLTGRETEIARLLNKNLSYKQIAAQLAISIKTVDKHIQNIFEKLAANNKTELLIKLFKL